MWEWVGKAIEGVVGSALGTLAWNMFGEQVKRFYQPQPDTEPNSTSSELHTAPAVTTGKPQRRPLNYAVQGRAGSPNSHPESRSLNSSDMSMLSQVLDSALTSVNSAYTSVNAAKDWVESSLSHTMSAPASPHTPVHKGEAGQWGDHNIDGALAAPPAAPPFGLATGVRRDFEATKTSDDRMKELRALLAGTTTPALPILPHGIINTSQEREPLSLSPTPSSADGSSPKSRIASLVESMRQRQETLQPDPSMASMNPVPLTPSITRPSPIAESTPAATPANGTNPPVVQQPPGIRLPEGLQPVVPPTPSTAPTNKWKRRTSQPGVRSSRECQPETERERRRWRRQHCQKR
ncbi:hypothetical protein QFC20_003259 [Naganishia adeliensis]|uniref:Uncharacterized protein n=1 Tax=Naganishia adeliensis TaxID=92952 RepID=A0ACC2WEE8_9TREE|nr:hypothetical protein QFC20_003259 [Naganishia adeliensis]